MRTEIFERHPLASDSYSAFSKVCTRLNLTLDSFNVRPHALDLEELVFTYQRRRGLLVSRGEDVGEIDQLLSALENAAGPGRLNWAICRRGKQEFQVLLLNGKYLSHMALAL